MPVANDEVRVLLGAGDGTFAPPSVFAVGTIPVGLAVGDLNNDGFDDIVTANLLGSITILINDGTGSFPVGNRQDISTPDRAKDVVIGDFDGADGLDLAVSVENTGVLIYENINNTGVFPTTPDQTISVGATRGLAVNDVDEDGKLDIVVADSTQSTINILYGKVGGGFDILPVSIGASRSDRVAVVDVTNDGHKDIVFTHESLDTVNLLKATDQNREFDDENIQTINLDQTPTSLGVGDFNDDGIGDVIVTSDDGAGSRPIALLYFGDSSGLVFDELLGFLNTGVFGAVQSNGVAVAEFDPKTLVTAFTVNNATIDFGDAPDPQFPTLWANNGASHELGSGLFLGSSVDADPNGQPDATATGDDADGNNDDDGVTLNSTLVPGQPVSFTIESSGAGFVDAWIDLDGDGMWSHPGEQFLESAPVVAGNNDFTALLPADAAFGITFARFRLSSTGGLSPTGSAADGEVEDYQLTIETVNRFVVDSTGDGGDSNPGDGLADNGSGNTTLRAAIEEANALANTAAGPDVIIFDLPGSGPHTIQPGSALPPISAPLVIDGTTEPDFNETPVVEVDGSAAGTGKNGLTVVAGGTGSTIRGLAVNRFGGHGIVLAGSDGNTIAGNHIGTNPAGTIARANGKAGVFVFNSDNNLIGGTTIGAGNLISGNTQQGIRISSGSTGNTVQGNLVGTNKAGTGSLGNLHGVSIVNAPSNVIGGTSAGAGNVISGNDRFGVQITGAPSTGNRIEGNLIGADMTGSGDLGNGFQGVVIATNAGSNTLGGTASGAGNVISGNDRNGVFLRGATNNSIQGNLIGTNQAGDEALGNEKQGIAIASAASGHTIGGTASGAGNVISANGQHGVRISGSSSGIVIQHNLIGTDLGGTSGLGNTLNGITIINASSTQIGGTAAAAGNVISDNRRGVLIQLGGSTGNLIQGNRIGTDVIGSELGNDFEGIRIIAGASDNTIGGTVAGAGNVIANNGTEGVALLGGTGNAIRQNSMFANGNLGIDLSDNGATANDAGDPDAGANNRQNFPEITSAVLDGGGNIDISYSVPSTTTNSAYPLTVEFFLADGDDQEGQTFLGSDNYATPGADNASVSDGGASGGDMIIATATDANGNTSEFSLNFEITNGAPLLAAGGAASGELQVASVESQSINQRQLASIVDAALARLAAPGASAEDLAMLSSVSFAIADLPGALLGLASDRTITLDVNAAGYGWYVDSTPYDDVEFADSKSQIQNPQSMDLLTVVMHELAHVLGHDHTDRRDDLMNETLPFGVRRLPAADDLDAVFGDSSLLDEMLW